MTCMVGSGIGILFPHTDICNTGCHYIPIIMALNYLHLHFQFHVIKFFLHYFLPQNGITYLILGGQDSEENVPIDSFPAITTPLHTENQIKQ